MKNKDTNTNTNKDNDPIKDPKETATPSPGKKEKPNEKKKSYRPPKAAQELLVPELSDKQKNKRLWLTVGALVLAAGAFAYGFIQLFNNIRAEDGGWVKIDSDRRAEGYGADLIFQYDLRPGEGSTYAKKKEVKAVYTALCTEAEDLFGTEKKAEELHNLCWLSQHPNEKTAVPTALKEALEKLQAAGNRTIYLAPLRDEYINLFLADDEQDAASHDPLTNPQAVAFREEVMRYASSAEHIDLRVEADGQVCLYVSEEYLAWARANEISLYLDFLWLKNAFVVDYIANGLTAKGLTYGFVSSFDGFTRNLDDTRSESYGQNLTDFANGALYTAAQMQYTGKMTLVSMRNYRLYDLDRFTCRKMADGSARTLYLDIKDGICRSAVDTLLAASKEKTCAETALLLASVYIADTLDTADVKACSEAGIDCFYVQNQVVFYTSQTCLQLKTVYADSYVTYRAERLP